MMAFVAPVFNSSVVNVGRLLLSLSSVRSPSVKASVHYYYFRGHPYTSGRIMIVVVGRKQVASGRKSVSYATIEER